MRDCGVFVPGGTTDRMPDGKWALAFDINVTGGYLVADKAEWYFLLAGGRLGKTNGQIIAVDGGLPEAFLR